MNYRVFHIKEYMFWDVTRYSSDVSEERVAFICKKLVTVGVMQQRNTSLYFLHLRFSPPAIREVLGSDLSLVTDVLTEVFRGFPELLQQNFVVVSEIALRPLPSSGFLSDKDAIQRSIASLHNHKSANNVSLNVRGKVFSAFDLVLRREDLLLWGSGGIAPPTFNSLCAKVGGPQSRVGQCPRRKF